MRKSIPLLVAGALVLSAGVAPVSAYAKTDPEARIAKITADRAAGEPVDCIQQNLISSTEIVNRTAIVYRMNNGTIYVNRPASGATFLSKGDVLVTDTHSTQLCSVDIVKLFDTGSRMQSGTVGLGKFVPYSKPPRSAAR